ncbi:MAG: D-alanine--D-alanine ligase [Chitinophagaceae bacterium]
MKKNIALVTGGFSAEATISYKTATTIYNHLDKDLFEVYKINISPKGWFYEMDGKNIKVNREDFSLQLTGKKVLFDAVFIGMHGTPGEDGKLQGYFDMLRLPYTSCNAATSAITFNKRYTVAVAAMAGIHVAKSIHLFQHSGYNVDEILSQLQLPVFVKPNNGGSSIGMSKVTEENALKDALEKAFKEDDQVLIEEMIIGREFTVGVFKSENKIHVLPVTEVISQKDFFDFEAKYEGKSSEVTPADIYTTWKEQIEEAAKKIYRIFNCSGVVRVDFIYNTTINAPFMLEINTVPGQTEESIVPQQVQAMGWSLKEFYTTIINDALKTAAVE